MMSEGDRVRTWVTLQTRTVPSLKNGALDAKDARFLLTF